MKRQKGQSLVEFALVTPFFLLLVFALIYSGMLFHDYNTLSNIARSAAREAAILESTSQTDYNEIAGHYTGQATITSLYTQSSFDVTPVTQDGEAYVEVRIRLTLRANTSTVMRIVLPDTYDIVYYMKKDTNSSST